MKYGKIIGTGNTATIYAWDEGKVLKLFNPNYPKELAEIEFYNAKAIRHADFAKPGVYELISFKERMGIIYDKVEGESLENWVLRTGELQKCAVYMAELHKSIIRNIPGNVPDYKNFLKYHVVNALKDNHPGQKEAFEILDRLQGGNTLCHGDFHPGNILISNGHTAVIDFMNICHGNFLYDVARTVFLVEYTPVPAEAENRDMLLHIKKTLADLYLIQMKVTREMIQDYISVIAIARRGECPDEQL